MLLAELLFFLFFMLVNGEPLRFLLSKRIRLLANMDVSEVFVFDVFLGGFLLYITAMLPFSLLNKTVITLLTAINILFSVLFHSNVLRGVNREKIKAIWTAHRSAIFNFGFVFSAFLVFLSIQLAPLSGLVLGSVHDTSIHSLMVQVILENGKVPLTLQPYLQEGIVYPQAAHVIFASASHVLGYNSAHSVFYVTPMFNALSVFGVYFLGRRLWDNRCFYLGLSFTFAFVSCWPLYITWGGNPFVVGFPFFLVCLGLLFSLVKSVDHVSLDELLIAGLLFGYSGTIVLTYLESLFVIGLLCVIYWFIHNRRGIANIIYKGVLLLAVSMLPLSPFLLRFMLFYQYPGHNIGVASDFVGYTKDRLQAFHTLQWLFDQLSPYLLPRIIILFLLIGLAVWAWKTRDYKEIKGGGAFALAIFVSSLLLSFISFILPADLNVVSWGHQGVILVIPVNIGLVFAYIKIGRYVKQHKPRKLKTIFSDASRSDMVVAVMFFSVLVTPFLYHRFFADPAYVRGLYDLFSVTTEDDYRLMLWMRDNLPSDAVVVVNPYDAGLFIPSISHHRIIFPYSASWYTRSYQQLTRLLWDDTLNGTAYALLQHFNVSHVFVGSSAAYKWVDDFIWNHNLFLGNPNFMLEQKVGNAYLFRVNYAHPHIAFLEDYEHDYWNFNKWSILHDQNGVGRAAAFVDDDLNRWLKVTAQCTWELEQGYAYVLLREIFAPRNSSISLAFNFSTENFGEGDSFAVIVANYYHNQTVVFATPNSVYDDYPNTISLGSFEGVFSIDLSALWKSRFNSALTNPFILEIVNYDADGAENIVYIDNLTVTASP